MSAPIRGILFDKDGTLIDFRASWLAAYRAIAGDLATAAGAGPALAVTLLLRLGYDPGADRFAADSPLLWATNAAIARSWSTVPELAGVDVAATVERHLADHARYPPRPVGDLPVLFDRLRRRGLKVGVATMDWLAPSRGTLAALGVLDRLDFLAAADSGHGTKPGPGMALAFCAACGLAPQEIAVVGDTAADLAMGRAAAAGLVVAVRTGGAPPEAFAHLADHVLDRATDIEILLDR